MLVIAGYIIILLSVFGGFALAGGHLYALIQPVEFIMIAGAALGSFLVGNSIKIIKETIKAVFSTLRGINYSRKFYVELLSMLFEIVSKMKKDGALSLEADIQNPNDSKIFNSYPLIKKEAIVMEFLSDYLTLIISGRVATHQLENIIDEDIETIIGEKEQPIMAIGKMADSLPAFGIVAAVMGVVHTMESMAILPPEALGGLIAKALVGTFLGVLLGYGFTAPLAVLLEHKLNATIKVLNAIKIVLIASVNNFSPSIAVEFGRKIIYSNERPGSKDLEVILKEIKQAKAGA